MTDGTAYWVAVTAVDQYGNTTLDVSSVGPTYPRNDIPSTTELNLEVSESTSIGSPFSLNLSATVDGVPSSPSGTIYVTMVTSDNSYLVSTDWNNISLTDFSELMSDMSLIHGDVTFWANYSGDVGDEQTRPIASASTSAVTTVMVEAMVSAQDYTHVLDEWNETDVRLNIDAVNSDQSSLLDGIEFDWVAFNATTNETTTGSNSFTNGLSVFSVNFPSGGTLFVNMSGPSWLDADVSTIEIQLLPYGEEEVEPEENETEEPWSPTSMLDVEIDCGEIVVDPDTDQEIDCTISNLTTSLSRFGLKPMDGPNGLTKSNSLLSPIKKESLT